MVLGLGGEVEEGPWSLPVKVGRWRPRQVGPSGRRRRAVTLDCLTVHLCALQHAKEELHPWPGVLAEWEK